MWVPSIGCQWATSSRCGSRSGGCASVIVISVDQEAFVASEGPEGLTRGSRCTCRALERQLLTACCWTNTEDSTDLCQSPHGKLPNILSSKNHEPRPRPLPLPLPAHRPPAPHTSRRSGS